MWFIDKYKVLVQYHDNLIELCNSEFDWSNSSRHVS